MADCIVITCCIPRAYEEFICSFFYDFEPLGIVTEDSLTAEQPATPEQLYLKIYVAEDNIDRSTLENLEKTLLHLLKLESLPCKNCSFSWDYYNQVSPEIQWQSFHRAIKVGAKLIIKPPWDDKTYQNRHAIIINPSMAFGTGQHQSTRLLLGFIEKQQRNRSVTILDCGCGSGILALAAAVCIGGKTIIAYDIDPVAVKQTRENSHYNKHGTGITIFCGTDRALKKKSFDLIFANLQFEILQTNGLDILNLLSEHGICLFSGLLIDEADFLRGTYAKMGYSCTWHDTLDEWKAFSCKRT